MENKMYFYGVYNKDNECLYIGKSVNPTFPQTRHKNSHSWSDEIHYFKVIFIEDDKEMGLINKHQPKYNKEKYTNGTDRFSVGDIFGHTDKSLNTHPPIINFPNTKAKRIRHKETGVIYESGYAACRAGLCGYGVSNILNTQPKHKYHDIFEFVD